MIVDLIKQLQVQNIELENQVDFQKQRADNAQQAYEYLMQQYKNLSRAHFGSKSEKTVDPNHPQQLLFDEQTGKSVLDTL